MQQLVIAAIFGYGIYVGAKFIIHRFGWKKAFGKDEEQKEHGRGAAFGFIFFGLIFVAAAILGQFPNEPNRYFGWKVIVLFLMFPVSYAVARFFISDSKKKDSQEKVLE